MSSPFHTLRYIGITSTKSARKTRMADFSQYGGVAPEWEMLVESQPQVEIPVDITPLELRTLTNDARAQVAQRLIQGVGRRALIRLEANPPRNQTLIEIHSKMMSSRRTSTYKLIRITPSLCGCIREKCLVQPLEGVLSMSGITVAGSCLALSMERTATRSTWSEIWTSSSFTSAIVILQKYRGQHHVKMPWLAWIGYSEILMS